jgi:hypothetical protein
MIILGFKLVVIYFLFENPSLSFPEINLSVLFMSSLFVLRLKTNHPGLSYYVSRVPHYI